MFNRPYLLENPNDKQFNLTDSEVYLFKESYELIEIEKYSYSLFAIWNCLVINIQRRIEEFGIGNFLDVLEKKELFNKDATTLKERWLNINEYKMIKQAKDLNIIDNTTHSLIKTVYWMKSNANENQDNNIDKNEIFSIIYLLQKNLFLKEFKKDMRKKDQAVLNNAQNRRKKDLEIIQNNSTINQNTIRRKKDLEIIQNNSTINQNTIQQNVNVFKKESYNTPEEEVHVIDEYC